MEVLEEIVERSGMSISEAIRKEHFDISVRKVSIGNSILSIKAIQRINFSEIFEFVNGVEEIFKKDPSNIYENMDYKTKEYDFDGKVCESKIFNNEDFGFNRIQIESPLFDENGELVTKGKKNQPVPDTAKRDYENVPLIEDIDSYFAREVKPYNADAWIDKSKTKVGYEIPFTRYFYKYQAPRCSDEIADIITTQEASIMASLKALFGESDN